jgi:antitoxin VapB
VSEKPAPNSQAAELAHKLGDEPPDMALKFTRKLRRRGNPEIGKPADKPFRDSLYED